MSPGYVTFSATQLEEKIVSGEENMWSLVGAGGELYACGCETVPCKLLFSHGDTRIL